MKSSNIPQLIKAQIIDINCGKAVKIIEPCNLYGCTIGDGSFIGPFVEIQSKANIGKNSKIQSHSFICSLVNVSDFCFIGHGVTFTNDVFKNGAFSCNENEWLPTYIEDHVSIGSGSTILPVRIVSGCVIGAGSVVTKDLKIKGVYAGNPAKLIRKL